MHKTKLSGVLSGLFVVLSSQACSTEKSGSDVGQQREALPVISRNCHLTLPREWLGQFQNDPAFSGLVVAVDGRTVELFYTGDVGNFDRLVPSARGALQNATQSVLSESGESIVVSLRDAELIPRVVENSLATLIDAHERLCQQLLDSGDRADARIDLETNRLVVRGETEIPSDIESLVTRGPAANSQPTELRNHRRPIVAGTQILYAGMSSTTGLCTLGYVARFGTTLRYLAASHCSPQLYGIAWPNPELRQNGWTLFDGIGTETLDPGPTCGANCRLTDSVAATVAFPAQTTFGSVAVPTMLGNLINPACTTGTCPETTIGNILPLSGGSGLLVGQTVEHIGRTTGRIQGRYNGTMAPHTYGSVTSAQAHQVVVLPGTTWGAGANLASQGDSGGPVLRWNGSGFTPFGILVSAAPGVPGAYVPEYGFVALSDVASDLGGFSVF